MKKKIKIEGMSCGHCVNHVKNALMEIGGISSVEVNLNEKYAVIESSDVSNDVIKNSIEDVGYDVVGIEEI